MSAFELYIKIIFDTAERANALCKMVSGFIQQREQLQVSLPFHINIIDELHINENGHSRILAKLLKYQRNGKWIILESLLDYIASNFNLPSLMSLKIDNPSITQEEERIDIWVRDKEYALILENKVYNAADQEAQLSRYIEKTLKRGYSQDQIYVVYLPQSPGAPDSQSWGCYEDAFKTRFACLSFQDGVANWLKEKVAPLVCSSDEKLLESAVVQYIDYLDGLFNNRDIFKKYYMILEKIISDNIGLESCSSTQEKYELLQKHIDEFYDFIHQMEKMRNDLRPIIIQSWWDSFKGQYPSVRKVEDAYIGYYFKFNSELYKVFISQEPRSYKLYCQIDKIDRVEGWTADEDALIRRGGRLRMLLPESNTTEIWKYFDYADLNGVFALFLKVSEELVSLGADFDC